VAAPARKRTRRLSMAGGASGVSRTRFSNSVIRTLRPRLCWPNAPGGVNPRAQSSPPCQREECPVRPVGFGLAARHDAHSVTSNGPVSWCAACPCPCASSDSTHDEAAAQLVGHPVCTCPCGTAATLAVGTFAARGVAVTTVRALGYPPDAASRTPPAVAAWLSAPVVRSVKQAAILVRTRGAASFQAVADAPWDGESRLAGDTMPAAGRSRPVRDTEWCCDAGSRPLGAPAFGAAPRVHCTCAADMIRV
jgi:hypothetical protein